jgi:hypothetical protein
MAVANCTGEEEVFWGRVAATCLRLSQNTSAAAGDGLRPPPTTKSRTPKMTQFIMARLAYLTCFEVFTFGGLKLNHHLGWCPYLSAILSSTTT